MESGIPETIIQKKEMKRFSFEMPEKGFQELEEMVKETGCKNRAELFNSALTILRWAIRQKQEGREVASIGYEWDDIIELEMPILLNVKPKAP
jgi:Arc/MetJ-type ribon-helix-helix transcriptional regulator